MFKRDTNYTKHGYALPRLDDLENIKNGETTIGYKYDGIGCYLAVIPVFGAVILNILFFTSKYMLIHSLLCVVGYLSMAPVFLIKKDYELFFARRYLAIIGPPLVAIVWFISGGISSPTGYIWLVATVSYNSFLVTGKKGKWYVSYAILTNLFAIILTLLFPQLLIPVNYLQKLEIYNILSIVLVCVYIGLTTWFQRKIAENMQDKMTEYNEELNALNKELEHHMQAEIEFKLKEELLVQQKKQSEEMTMLLVKTLSDTIEAKDEYTRGHSSRVSEYAAIIAQKMELSEEDVEKIRYAATLHDIGKIGVPDTVLNKPSRLTNEEYEIIKTHSSIGADILQNIEIIAYTADIARHHHERYDGKGYPDGLVGDENSIGARIVAVADSFDAMNSERIYRKPLAREIVINEIEKNKGIQFDPVVADVFLELLKSGIIDEITNKDNIDNDIDSDSDSINDDAGRILSAVVNSMKNSNAGSTTDLLTGLMVRGTGEEQIASLMSKRKGALIFCDMDNLKPINDRFGHKAGDKALKTLGGIIKKYGEGGVSCRIGGDEFLLYLDDVSEAEAIEAIEAIIADFKESISQDIEINIATLSIGVCLSTPNDIYSNILNKADKALYHVKQRGKAGYYFYREESDSSEPDNHVDIKQVTKSIEESGKYEGALDVEYRQFAKLYEYLHKVCERYEHSCSIVLVTLDSKYNKTMYIDSIEQDMHYMEMAIQSTIRTVDICTRYSSVQFLIVLLEATEENVDTIMNRIFASYYKMSSETGLVPRYEVSTLFENN